MFVRNIDLALQRAEASYSRETWQKMTASERSAAIYREMQTLDAQSNNDGMLITAENWVLPRIACSHGSPSVKHTSSKQVEAGTAVHGAFQHFEATDLPLYGAGSPR